MNFLIIITLAIIQGLTEFLPVSSSGHLVLLYNIFGIENNQIILSVLLHLSTLLAVIIYYRKQIVLLIKNPLCSTNKKIILTTIITCIMVVILKPFIYQTFNGNIIFIFFIITAFMLFISDFMSNKYIHMSSNNNFNITNTSTQTSITNINISYKQAIIIGITQGVACIPGISRSGSTIAIAKTIGINGDDCSTYSFLISIPIIIASLILECIEGVDLSILNLNFLVSMIVCFLVGILCIKIMVRFVNKNRLSLFSYYLLALATFIIINNIFLNIF